MPTNPTPWIEAMENIASGTWTLAKAAAMTGMPIEQLKARLVVTAGAEAGGKQALSALARQALLRFYSQSAVTAMLAEAATVGGGIPYVAAGAAGAELAAGAGAAGAGAAGVGAGGAGAAGAGGAVSAGLVRAGGAGAARAATTVATIARTGTTLFGIGVGWWALLGLAVLGLGVAYSRSSAPDTAAAPPTTAELPLGLNAPPTGLPPLPPGDSALPGAAAATSARPTVMCTKITPFATPTQRSDLLRVEETRVSFTDPSTGATNTIDWEPPPGTIRQGDMVTLVSRSSHFPDGPPMYVQWEFGAGTPYRWAHGATTKTDDELQRQEAAAGRTESKLSYEGGAIRIVGGLYRNEPGTRFAMQWDYNCQ